MKKPLKGFLYSAIVVFVYSLIIFSIYTPADFYEAWFGPSEKKAGIISFQIQSEFQESPVFIKVLTPRKIDPHKKHAVVYVLPVTTQGKDPWWMNGLRTLAKHGIADRYGVICVSPMFVREPWYADHPLNPKIRQESYVIKEVVPFVDEHFPTLQESKGRYLLGFSKSGFGALSLLLRHPDIFGGAAVWDSTLIFDDLNFWGSGLKEVFGTKENLREYYIPVLLEKKANDLRQHHSKIVLMGYAFPNTKKQTEEIHQLLDSLGIPHIYNNQTKRKHTWNSGWLPFAVEYVLGDKRD